MAIGVDRVVNAVGLAGLAGTQFNVGFELRRVSQRGQ